MDFMGPFTFNAITFFIGAISLIPVICIFDKQRPDAAARKLLWKYGLIAGLVLFAASNLQQVGVDLTNSAGKSGFITGLYIILVPIAGIFMKRRAGKFTWIGAVFAVVGMYFLCVQDGFGSLTAGDWALFTGAFFWAAHIIVIDRFAPHVSALRLSQIQFVICGVLCAVVALSAETIVPSLLLSGWIPLLYRGLGSIGTAYTLQVIGQRYVAPSKASVIFSLESVFSAIGGAILIHEVMTGRAYFGCALIFCGILLSQIRPKNKSTVPAEGDRAKEL
jgi:drug/metabolite transporter (DMT)-like permease